MPKYDKTGPEGEGPMTGRNQGYCGKENREKRLTMQERKNIEPSEQEEVIYGRGRGGIPCGCGFGRGGRRGQGRNFRQMQLENLSKEENQ